MKRTEVAFTSSFEVVLGDERSQAAVMVLKPGAREGGPDNKHRGADQWIYVVSGSGQATVCGETFDIAANTLLLVQRGDTHGFRNTGHDDLRILTFYVPPAYTADGDELPAGQG